MQRYSCPVCANEVHFDNTACIGCGTQLGYAPHSGRMLGKEANSTTWQAEEKNYGPCANRTLIGCNWLVDGDAAGTCLSCRHTAIIPDLSAGENLERWAKLEHAKRTLFYSLLKFALPLPEPGGADGPPLRFELKADTLFWDGSATRVVTGHENGVITINIAEADDDAREKHRIAMGEPYRTLVGHFRHEVGHYYWDRLIACNGDLEGFRSVFGDERDDYSNALDRHYRNGPPLGWPQSFVSAYAASHAWEDFAETWSHYFHIVDGLETAQAYGIGRDGTNRGEPYREANFQSLIDAWIPLTIAMNAVNRSIGNRDFYPFVLSGTISAKLEFVHRLIHRN